MSGGLARHGSVRHNLRGAEDHDQGEKIDICRRLRITGLNLHLPIHTKVLRKVNDRR
jgi:hypothetical protein